MCIQRTYQRRFNVVAPFLEQPWARSGTGTAWDGLSKLEENTNVVYLTSQEYTGPKEFVEFWLDTILEWERETGKQVHLGLGATKDVLDAIPTDPVRGLEVDTIDLRYWWIEPNGNLYAPTGGSQDPVAAGHGGQVTIDSIRILTPAVVPEPASALLLGLAGTFFLLAGMPKTNRST